MHLAQRLIASLCDSEFAMGDLAPSPIWPGIMTAAVPKTELAHGLSITDLMNEEDVSVVEEAQTFKLRVADPDDVQQVASIWKVQMKTGEVVILNIEVEGLAEPTDLSSLTISGTALVLQEQELLAFVLMDELQLIRKLAYHRASFALEQAAKMALDVSKSFPDGGQRSSIRGQFKTAASMVS